MVQSTGENACQNIERRLEQRPCFAMGYFALQLPIIRISAASRDAKTCAIRALHKLAGLDLVVISSTKPETPVSFARTLHLVLLSTMHRYKYAALLDA